MGNKRLKRTRHDERTTFILHTVAMLFIVHSSFLIVSCPNPWVNAVLQPKTATFETNGGSHVPSQIVYREYPVKRPPNPVKSGYTFDAWYEDNVTFENEWDFNTVPNRDITLYANWIDGGTIILPVPVTTASLQATINNATSGATIVLPAGTWLMDSGIYVNKDITITTAAGTVVTLSQNGYFDDQQLISVESGGTLTLGNGSGGTIILRGDPVQPSRGVLVETGGKLIMNDGVTITDFSNVNFGGGVYVDGIFEMKGGTIQNNTGDGGGVHVYGNSGTFTMSGGTISNNTANSYGGGVMCSGTFIMSGGTITNNNAPNSGGGVYMAGGTFTMSGGTIYGNTAPAGRGASVYRTGGTAQYGDGSAIISSGNGTDDPLTGH